MKRYWIIGAIIALLGVTGYLLYDRSDNAMAAEDYSNWSPNAGAIRQKIGKSDGNAAGEERRLIQFCKLFQSRFRNHDPAMAIGLRNLTPNRLKLMCPARMEPVDIDRITLTAWREAKDAFDHSFDLDIYLTFIGTPPIKIGELRPRHDNPKIASISYNYPQNLILPHPRHKKTSEMNQSSPVRFIKKPPVSGSLMLPPPNQTDKPSHTESGP